MTEVNGRTTTNSPSVLLGGKNVNVDNAQRIGLKIYKTTGLILEILVLFIQIFITIGESLYKKFSKPNHKDITGEIVLITGAGHGIGKELAIQLATKHPIIVCWDINAESNNKTVEEVKRLGAKAYGFVCDVSSHQEVLRVAKEVQSKVGDISILINNAGILRSRKLLEHKEEDILSTFNINVFAHFWMLEAFLPSMIEKNHGHIVALSSMAGQMGLENLVPYCASKYAVRGLMDALRVELKANNSNSRIKLTTICPYIVDTGLCPDPKIRFPKLFPIVKIPEAANEIKLALLNEEPEISIPRHILTPMNVSRLLPEKANQLLHDFTGILVSPDAFTPKK